FDFEARDVLATSDHHVLGAIDDVQITLVVDAAEVTRLEPATAERLLGRVRPVPIPGHDRRARHPDLADRAECDVATVTIDDAEVEHGDRNSDAGRTGLVVGAAAARRE